MHLLQYLRGCLNTTVPRNLPDMHVSGKFKAISAVVVVLSAVAALTMWTLRPLFMTHLVGVHQRSVTRSLAKWAKEDSNITNDASAIRAAEMVGYLSRYYVPGEGYRGPARIEVALEAQRQHSIQQLVASLERYTGLACGTNVERWTEWARAQTDRAQHPQSREPTGRSNPSQQVGSATNRTSSAGLPSGFPD